MKRHDARTGRRETLAMVPAIAALISCGSPHRTPLENGAATASIAALGLTETARSETQGRISVDFDLRGDDPLVPDFASSLEPGCLAALDYQNRFEEKYIEGKLKLLGKIRKVNANGTVEGTSTTTKNPLSLTVTFGVRSQELNQDRDSETTGSGGAATVGGGSAGGGAGGVTVQAPSQTTVGEELYTGTLEFTAGISLSKPLGNQIQISNIPGDEVHLIREATNAFYRLPIFCKIMKECKGFGLPEKNHDTALYCGASFSFSGGSGGMPGGGR
jgi:hypothetical protein